LDNWDWKNRFGIQCWKDSSGLKRSSGFPCQDCITSTGSGYSEDVKRRIAKAHGFSAIQKSFKE